MFSPALMVGQKLLPQNHLRSATDQCAGRHQEFSSDRFESAWGVVGYTHFRAERSSRQSPRCPLFAITEFPQMTGWCRFTGAGPRLWGRHPSRRIL